MDFSGNFQNSTMKKPSCWIHIPRSTSSFADPHVTIIPHNGRLVPLFQVQPTKKNTKSNEATVGAPCFSAKMLVLPWRPCRSICYLLLPIPAPEKFKGDKMTTTFNRYNWGVENHWKFHDNCCHQLAQTFFWGFKHPEK